jgi:hypothetical protein
MGWKAGKSAAPSAGTKSLWILGITGGIALLCVAVLIILSPSTGPSADDRDPGKIKESLEESPDSQWTGQPGTGPTPGDEPAEGDPDAKTPTKTYKTPNIAVELADPGAREPTEAEKRRKPKEAPIDLTTQEMDKMKAPPGAPDPVVEKDPQ